VDAAPPTTEASARPAPHWRVWAFAVVPLLGVLEVGAHVVETHRVVPPGDWALARQYVATRAKPDDLIVFAPRWSDPIGRMVFGDDLASIARETRADETRFARAFEVSIRGAHASGLTGWRSVEQQRLGRVTVTTWQNPSPAVVIDDLISHVDPEHLTVSRGADDCPFRHGTPESGGTGFGPAVPADRFVCKGGSFVGVSIFPDLDYNPRRAILAPPSTGAPLRMRFHGVHFGKTLHGHHGLYSEAERDQKGAQITIKLKANDLLLGSFTHNDGESWKSFELETPELQGQEADLVVEVSAPRADRRTYGFVVDTR
jgi:hypothetical protein